MLGYPSEEHWLGPFVKSGTKRPNRLTGLLSRSALGFHLHTQSAYQVDPLFSAPGQHPSVTLSIMSSAPLLMENKEEQRGQSGG